MQITKYVLSVGLNDKDTKQPKYDLITSYKLVETILKQYTNGYTIYQCNGGYKHQDESFVNETSLRVELMFIDKAIVKKVVDEIKSPIILNQESIAVEIIKCESDLW